MPFIEEAYLPILHMPGVWWGTLGLTGRKASNISSSLSTPALALPDESRVLQDSIGIMQWAEEHRQDGAPSLFSPTGTPGVSPQAEAAFFVWLRDNLDPEPVDAKLPGAPPPTTPWAGPECLVGVSMDTLPNVPATVVDTLPPPVRRALADPKPSSPASNLPPASFSLTGKSPLELMRHWHDRVGPLTRRLGYHYVLSDPDLFSELTWGNTGGLQAAVASTPARHGIIGGIKALNINRAAAMKALGHLKGEFAAVEELLAGGQPFLGGAAFGAADLYWACMAAPALMVQPSEGMNGVYPWKQLPDDFLAASRAFRASAAGRHALACFALYRTRGLDVPEARL